MQIKVSIQLYNAIAITGIMSIMSVDNLCRRGVHSLLKIGLVGGEHMQSNESRKC